MAQKRCQGDQCRMWNGQFKERRGQQYRYNPFETISDQGQDAKSTPRNAVDVSGTDVATASVSDILATEKTGQNNPRGNGTDQVALK